MVRVTLLEQYPNSMYVDPDTGDLVLRYGTGDARIAMGSNVDPQYFSDGINNSAVLASLNGTRPPAFIPGEPVLYRFSWDDKDRRAVIMPEDAAKTYFGDWDLPQTKRPEDGPQVMTRANDYRRLAARWGGFTTATRGQAGLNGVPQGWRQLPKIVAPPMPNVEVVKLDSQMRVVKGWTWKPLDWHKFTAELDKDFAAKAPTEGPPLGGFTMEMLNAYIEKAVADKLAAAGKGAAR